MPMAVTLKPHQQKAVNALRPGNILCGGTGVGKSLTALAYYYLDICHGVQWQGGKEAGPMLSPRPLYIITTARKRDTKEWEDELTKFGMTDGEVEVTIDSWNNLHKYVDVSGAFFIFDEQRVTGRGEWVKSFYKVARKNLWILLSATPGDTWLDYVPVFVANGFYRNRSEFIRKHVIYSPYVTKFPKIQKIVDIRTLEMLRRRITVTMEYEKHTVPHWHDIWVDYDEARYRTVFRDRFDPWKEEPIKDIAGCCYLMRRAANDKKTVVMSSEGRFECSERALEVWHLGMEKHPKLIVFYNYDYELEALRECFDRCREANLYSGKPGFSVGEWNGHRHDPIPDSSRWFYLVQYAAGAEGWNCVETDALVFYSLNYSYKQTMQAAGRIDRMNTPFSDLHYYVIKSKAPIDIAIWKALKGKKAFNEKAFFEGVM